MIQFTFSAVLTVADHVRANPSREVGGLLLAGPTDGNLILEAAPIANAAHTAEREFSIDPEAMSKAIAAAEQRGLDFAGTFHSHPNGSATMSAADVALATSTGLLLIVAPGPEWQWRLYFPDTLGDGSIAASIAFPYSVKRST